MLHVLMTALLVSGAHARSIQGEINALEARLHDGDITSRERERLAEIYFMTSRCGDVVKVLSGRAGHGSLLACVCGGPCLESYKVERFRRLLEMGHSWDDDRVQHLWRSVRDEPEARYWAVKALRNDQAVRAQDLRFDLEKSLESLEVQPK